MVKSVESIVNAARSRLRRLTPENALRIVEGGGILVDIRPYAQRVLEGEIPAALVIERNVLEWRFDLQDRWHIPQVTNYDQPVVVICSEGYTSSLAAVALQDLGFVNATDVNGGFRAWQNAGLATQPGGTTAIH